MRVAKNYDETSMAGGAVGYIGERPAKAKIDLADHFAGKALGGRAGDVVQIGFSLDVGDIAGTIDGAGRRKAFRKLWGRFGLSHEEQEGFFQNQQKDMQRILSAAMDGIPIRIWKSNAAYSACGFYFVCKLLKNMDCKVSVVSLPSYWQAAGDKPTEYSHWGEVPPGKFYQFLPLEKELFQAEKERRGENWHRLAEENAPLRAVVNGKLVSVPENFYDFMISENLPAGDFMMARFIGKLLAEYRLGISDNWLALRMEKMVGENRLMVVGNTDPTHPYGKILRRK
ncbi:MAG: DUF3658 domain-containing protein [Christensenellales bacterium]